MKLYWFFVSISIMPLQGAHEEDTQHILATQFLMRKAAGQKSSHEPTEKNSLPVKQLLLTITRRTRSISDPTSNNGYREPRCITNLHIGRLH